jgi:hypothetical protein
MKIKLTVNADEGETTINNSFAEELEFGLSDWDKTACFFYHPTTKKKITILSSATRKYYWSCEQKWNDRQQAIVTPHRHTFLIGQED